MSKPIRTIEHVVLERKPNAADAFVAFWSDGTAHASIWNGSSWKGDRYISHEEGIELAASYVRRGYKCVSIITGEVA